MQAVWQARPEHPTDLWTIDEHCVGHQPILRRVWAPCGQQPQAIVQPRYEWLDVYACVQPPLHHNPELIKAYTSFWWWPQAP
jgi:hypothetical protein